SKGSAQGERCREKARQVERRRRESAASRTTSTESAAGRTMSRECAVGRTTSRERAGGELSWNAESGLWCYGPTHSGRGSLPWTREVRFRGLETIPPGVDCLDRPPTL